METELIDPRELDIPGLIRGRAVTVSGQLGSMSRTEFQDLLEANGARFTPFVGRGVALVVVGDKNLPVAPRGALPPPLQTARRLIRQESSRIRVVSEQQFLAALGVEAYRDNAESLYTLSTLTEILDVPRDRVRAWVAAELIRPGKIEYGVWYFDFRQVTAAKKLWELVRSGVSIRRLRATLEQLRRWMPEAAEPLHQLSILESKAQILARLEEGELIEPDGQLILDFHATGESESLKILPGPRTAFEWFAQGYEQEQQGFLAEATESYRQALMLDGSNHKVCFNLANVLRAQGKKLQALERYLQTVEMDPGWGHAWNNLGVLLLELGRHEDARAAFRRAASTDPDNPQFIFNLADALDKLNQHEEAAACWKQYLRHDQTSERAQYARDQSAAG